MEGKSWKSGKEFSVLRLKKRVRERKEEWMKVLKSKEDTASSLDRSILLYVSKKEENGKKSIDENLVNLKSSYWSGTLRNSKLIT